MAKREIKINEKYQALWTEDYDIAIVVGSRASGKSFGCSTFLTDLTTRDNHGILFTRFTMTAAETSIIPEFNDKLERLGLIDHYDITKRDITSKHNDSFIMFRGIKTSSGNQTAKLKSIPGLTTFVIDEAEEFVSEKDFDTIYYSIRQKGMKNRVIFIMNAAYKTHWIYRRFFDPHNLPEEFSGQIGRVLHIHTTYEDNIENLSAEFLAEAEQLKKSNPKKYNHILRGHWLDEKENALWKQLTMIDPYRVFEAPEAKRTVTAVDPSVSDSDGDECGIGTCIIDHQTPAHFYVISDVSGQMTNREWGQTAVGEYKRQKSDCMVAEKNQGGDLVKMNIHNIDPNIEPKLVSAKKSKMLRAEPIAALYEAGRVHHVGYFPELEDEMTSYDGTGDSPNRLDWLVYALTELSQNDFEEPFIISF